MVVGDLMLDEYLWGRVERISPEAPVQVVEVVRETAVLGGAGNVVRNLIALGAGVLLAGAVGPDETGQRIRALLERDAIDGSGVFEVPGRRTGLKSRVMAGHQQVVRIDRESTEPLDAERVEAIIGLAADRMADLDGLILSDYAKGVLTPELTAGLIELFGRAGKPIVVDPKGDDYARYRGASLITPNQREAGLALGLDLTRPEAAEKRAAGLLDDYGWRALMVTRGGQGLSLFSTGAPPLHVPARARQVFDVSGAGDTVVAVSGLGLACGWPLDKVARLANLAGGVVVGKVGTAALSVEDLLRAVRPGEESKIVSPDEIEAVVDRLKAAGKRIVFTNGCFDLLHVGHVHFLRRSKELGEVLIVGLDDDESVARLKGEGRPVIGQEERARLMAALDFVDYVTIFTTERLPELLDRLAPDVLTKGANYAAGEVVGREVVEKKGGRVELIPLEGELTTSGLVERVRSNGQG